MVNPSEIILTLLAGFGLLLIHVNRERLGFLATLGFLILTSLATFALSFTPYLFASASSLYITQFGLALILIFDGLKRWRSSLIVILGVAVLCSAALRITGNQASQHAIVDTLSLLVAGFLKLTEQNPHQKSCHQQRQGINNRVLTGLISCNT